MAILMFSVAAFSQTETPRTVKFQKKIDSLISALQINTFHIINGTNSNLIYAVEFSFEDGLMTFRNTIDNGHYILYMEDLKTIIIPKNLKLDYVCLEFR